MANLLTVCGACHNEAEEVYWQGKRPKRSYRLRTKLQFLTEACNKCGTDPSSEWPINPICLDCKTLLCVLRGVRTNPEAIESKESIG